MSAATRAGGALVGLALTAAIVAGSQWPWQPEPHGEASIRLSWRTVSEPMSECRVPTAEELEALPPHMRRKEICERRHAPFRLRVRVDDQVARDRLLSPAGVRGDRPLYVFEEMRVPPGPHRIVVSFSEERPAATVRGKSGVTLTLATELSLEPRDIALVTLDDSANRLALTLPDR